MDVCKATIAVVVAEGVWGGEVRQHRIFPNRAEVLAQAGGPGGDRRRLPRRAAAGRQTRPGCGRQDAVRRRGGDDGRAQAQAAQANGRQRLSEKGDRAAGEARPRRRQQHGQRRSLPVGGRGRGRLRPLSHGDWLGRQGRQVGLLHPCAVGDGARFATGAAQGGWVNTALGNIKTALAGTYHHISAKHAQRYLSSFAWRFNRRFQLDTLTEARLRARTAPIATARSSGSCSPTPRTCAGGSRRRKADLYLAFLPGGRVRLCRQ